MGSLPTKREAISDGSFSFGSGRTSGSNFRLLYFKSLTNKWNSASNISWCGVFCQLPDALLLKILSYLSVQDRLRVSAVCRRWRQVSLDKSLWKQIDFSCKTLTDYMNIRDRTIIYLTTQISSSAIRHIDLSSRACRNITDVSLFYIARHCHKLQGLKVSNCRKITDAGLKIIAQTGNCPNLQILEIERCEKLTNENFPQALRRLPELKKLNIGGNKWVTSGTLANIARYCPHLTSLSIEGCKKVTDTSLNILASKCAGLKHINVRNTRSVTNTGMETFLKKLSDLETLEIGIVRRSRANAAVLNAVAENCSNLVKFDYQDCNTLQVDEAICHIAHNCLKLQHLAVRQCLVMCKDTIETLKNTCPHLRWIDQSVRFYNY